MRPSEYLSRIAASSGAVASGIGELAGAEVKSSAKGLGIGASLFAGVGLFGYTSLKILGFGVGFLFAWIFWKAAGLSVLFSLFLGFVVLFVLFLVVVAAMAIIGKGQFKHVKLPQGTIDEVKASFGAIGTSIPAGVKDAEDALDEAKVVKAQTKAAAAANVVSIVRDPIFLARQRRASRAAG